MPIPSTSDITLRLKKLIAEELDTNLEEDRIADNAKFFADGLGIDSIAIVELISLVEEKFNLQFTDADLVPESFGDLQSLSLLVASKLATPD